jgi:TBC1 domain family member 15
MRAQLLTLDHLVQLMDPKLYLHLQSAESTNFFFFFRMLLVWYKREFEWHDVLRLWEGLWTDYYSANFHIFVALAILERHRDVIMTHLKHFDEVLKYGECSIWKKSDRRLICDVVNELSGTMDLESTLIRAESLFRRFQRTVETLDKKHNFPSPPSDVRNRKSIAASPPPTSPGPSSSTNDRRKSTPAVVVTGTDKGKQAATDGDARVISAELRNLLSRKVEKLDKSAVEEHGGGVGPKK